MTVAVLLGLLLLGLGAERVTGEMCGSCHEIAYQVATNEVSPHERLRCPDCHEPAIPWYRFPQTLGFRAYMLAKNIGPHLSARREGADPLADIDVEVPNSTCLRCHSPSREVTVHEDGTVLDHEWHARENGTCVSCHRYTAHPDVDADQSLLFMSVCFDCHGQEEDAKAPGDCDVCHPGSFELQPGSHDEDWQARHGTAALDERDLCMMCHPESLCDGCHGLPMPHPEDWVAGSVRHSAYARTSAQTCARCHDDGPQFCTSCHHERYQPFEPPWLTKHPTEAKRHGATDCFDCHEPTACVRCHTAPWEDAPEE